MIGTGVVFTTLRTSMFDSVAVGGKAIFRAETTLGDWLSQGAFSVTNCNFNGLELSASSLDYGQMCMCEVENLLNHCLEHLQELAASYYDERQRSTAWAVTTAYYLGFFATSALLRLIGTPVAFFATEQMKRLQKMAGATSRPGQGAFKVLVAERVSMTHSRIQIRKADRIHEATWKTAFGTIEAIASGQASMSVSEALFYEVLCSRAPFFLGSGFDWPSVVRNRVNYRPGFGYQLRHSKFPIRQILEAWRGASEDKVLEILRSTESRVSGGEDFRFRVEMMFNTAIVTYLLVRKLYRELVERGLTDRRWEHSRDAFQQTMCIKGAEFPLWAE